MMMGAWLGNSRTQLARVEFLLFVLLLSFMKAGISVVFLSVPSL